MIAIFKREIMNYLKRPLFWVGVLLVIYGVFNATSPYLTTHYLTTGEKIINDQSNTSVEGEVYEGYIPATPEKHREVWHEKVKIKLTDVFGLTDSEAQNVIEKLESMNLKEAYAYLEQEYDWYGARYLYEDSTYYKGTAEEINAYLDKKLEDKTFSFYYARKFADFAGLYMVFFAIIMLAVLFLQDTKKHTYELLHCLIDIEQSDFLGGAGKFGTAGSACHCDEPRAFERSQGVTNADGVRSGAFGEQRAGRRSLFRLSHRELC